MRGGDQHIMLASESDAAVIDGESGVTLVEWPECQADLEDLARRGVPRLLLVAPTITPPLCTDSLEDWVRLPVDDTELRARLLALAERQRLRLALTIDEHGVPRQDNTLILLSPYEQRIAEVLIENFGTIVPKEVIERRLWSELDPSSIAMRVHISRLRKRIAPLGLKISCVVGVGYVMHRESVSPRHRDRVSEPRPENRRT
jgi:two-component system, OmpR family, response regulator